MDRQVIRKIVRLLLALQALSLRPHDNMTGELELHLCQGPAFRTKSIRAKALTVADMSAC